MIDFDSARNMERITQILAAGQHTLAQVAEIRKAAAKSKPIATYDADSAEKAAYYHRRAHAYTLTELKRRFPGSYGEMPQVSVDFMRHIAATDATVYDQPAQRWIMVDGARLSERPVEDDADEPVDAAVDARDDAFSRLVRDSRIDYVMREAERRVVLTKTVFLRLGWDAIRKGLDGVGRPTISIYWPHEVDVLCHPDAPADMRAAIAIIAQRAGDQQGGGPLGSSGVVELWTRGYEETNGVPTFGPWRAEIIDKNGSAPLYGDGVYPLRDAPWLALTDGIPDRSVFLDDDTDILTVAKAINVTWSSTLYQYDMAGYPQAYTTGTERMEDKPIASGPGRVWALPDGSTVGQLDAGFSLDGVRMLGALTGTVAATREQPPSAYSADPSARQESGVARKIANIPQIRAAKERSENWRDFEEHSLLPALTAIWDYWGEPSDGQIAIAHGPRGDGVEGAVDPSVTFHVEHAEDEDYEDPTERQARLLELYERGLITKASLGVSLGLFDSEEDATEFYGDAGIRPSFASTTPTPRLSEIAAPGPVSDGALKSDLSGDTMTKAAVATDSAVQDTALNGAQVTSLLAIIERVSLGTLTKETASALISASFPLIPPERITAMINGVTDESIAANRAMEAAPAAGAQPVAAQGLRETLTLGAPKA